MKEIIMTTNVVITFLDTLLNSLTFANLHYLDILTGQNLETIIKTLRLHHEESDIINNNIYNWYSKNQTTC